MAATQFAHTEFVYLDSVQLDVTDAAQCRNAIEATRPDFCINAAAYTAVDRAEQEPDLAHRVNVIGAANLAQACLSFGTILVQVSTDFVFDGKSRQPYTETDEVHPLGVYGTTKWEGEQAIRKILDRHLIVRTSWLYSSFGHNFMKTMLRLAQEGRALSVVNDQIGNPTHAMELATALIEMIQITAEDPAHYFGTYHYSSQGQCSWYEFAKEIFRVNGVQAQVSPISSSEYPTPAKRPAYSVLDKSKVTASFGLSVKTWANALHRHHGKDS